MKNLMTFTLLLLAVAVAGCGDGFPDEEMHLGLDDKVRPYAVVIDPPEASPGDTVQVTLHARAPRPGDLDITWRVALDFDRGLYDVDGIERNHRSLSVPLPTFDGDGFLTQTFSWVVPDSSLLYASSIPAQLDDPALAGLTALLPGLGTGTTLRKDEVDAWLKALDQGSVQAMEPAARAATWALADRFACAVRFRATLRTDIVVDVTRNLTIRQTRRLGGPNTNLNARLKSYTVVAVEKADASESDIGAPGVVSTFHPFLDAAGEREADRVEVPLHDGWTYYLTADFTAQEYTSPWDPSFVILELATFRWYYYRQDAPASAHRFYATRDGSDAEMWNLDRYVRLMPDGVGSTFRLVAVVRDERGEWRSFNATPGTALAEGIVTFVAP